MNSTIRRRGARAAIPALLGAVVLAAWPAMAGATVIDKQRFSDSGTDTVEECGRTLDHEFSATGTGHTRVGKGKFDTAFFGHSNVSFTDTFTNPANDRFYTMSGRLTFQETKAVPVGGTIFEFTSINAGTVRLADSNGNTVLVDHGNVRTTILFDTLGDSTPGGVMLALLSEQTHGPHPLFNLTEDEFCALTDTLLG
jgi:hypothetical protein